MLERGTDESLDQLGQAFAPGPFLDRRLGRGLAFQALYEMDLAHRPPGQVLDRQAASFAQADPSPYPPEVLHQASGYARELVAGVLTNRTAIDGLIQQRAPLWPLAQMSAVDRNVLRIGLYESLFGNATVPLRTAINEAVELAKLFGSETSAKFVNGVLGRAVEASTTGDSPHQPPLHAASGSVARSAAPTETGDAPSHLATPARFRERGLDDGRER